MLVCLVSPIETANIQTARHDLVCGNFSFYTDSKALLYGAIFVCPLFKHLDSSSTGTIVVNNTLKTVTVVVTVQAYEECLLVSCLQLGSQLHCSPGTFPNFFLQSVM